MYPREKLSPSEWAERYRVLSADESSEPGPYSFDRTPYWRFVCDLIARPGIEEIVCLKGAQIGWSELCRNVLGYWIDADPGPTLIVTPDRQSADAFKIERVEPLLRNTPAVARHMSPRAWDETKYRIRLDSMWVFLAWAGSKTGVKSRPIRNLIFEEPDEYPPFSSAGGDPLAKALKRVTTYRDKGLARVLTGGTPTTRRGNTWKRWELCSVRYHPWVPCPHCNGYQQLQWKQVKWPDLSGTEPDRARRAERIKSEGLAHYECEHCKGECRDHHKPRMLRRLVWATEDQAVTADGRVVGPERRSSRVGVKVSALYSPFVTFGELAAEWIESQGDPDALCDFVNQRLAETFEEQRAKTEPDFIRQKVQVRTAAGDGWQPAPGAPVPMLVPAWTRALVATADTQGTDERTGYFWYVIRAWGLGYRSQLVDYGVCHSKAELAERCLNRPIPIEGSGDRSTAPSLLLVDSGGPRTGEIYELSQSDPRIRTFKGSADVRRVMVDDRVQKATGVVLWYCDTEQSKDLLYRLIHDPDRTKWMPHRDITDDYCRQLADETKIYDPAKRRERWIDHGNNHLFDCEQMQAAAAWRLGMGTPEPPAATAPPVESQKSGWVPETENWLNR